MSASKEARIELSGVIKEKIQDAKSVVFVKFNGLTVAEDTELRREFRKNNVEYKVYKNTLVRKAAKEVGIEQFNDELLVGTNAIAFGYEDPVAPARILKEFMDSYMDVMLKGMYMMHKENDNLNATDLIDYFIVPVYKSYDGFMDDILRVWRDDISITNKNMDMYFLYIFEKTSVFRSELKDAVEEYLLQAKKKTERERMTETRKVTGVFSGSYATNPLTGDKVPVWISEYVLAGYGTGAIMAVPAHDSRDYAFARHFELPIIPLIEGCDVGESSFDAKEGIMCNSGFLNGMTVKEAIPAAIDYVEQHGIGRRKINYRLRDAIFSRQRYWGEPFPMYFKDGIATPMPLDKLPLELPEVDKFLPTETGEPPLGRASGWTIDGYPIELSTMPGFAGSSAYYLRYMDPHNSEALVSKEADEYWRDVDLYIGGTEHATGHLIYSRFWNKFLFDLGHVCENEPFRKLINQGMIQGRSNFVYRVIGTNTFVSLGLKDQYETTEIHVDVNIVRNDRLDLEAFKAWMPEFATAEFILEDGEYICGWAVEKMSKSMFNVVNPDLICDTYGADTLRLYEMFLGPLEQSKPWDTKGIDGVNRFIRKVWRLFYDRDGFIVTDEKATPEELKALHKLIGKVRTDIEAFSFNTAVSAFMIAVNELTDLKCCKREILEQLVVLLSPFAPHISEELWEALGHTESITYAAFPEYIEAYTIENTCTYAVSFNGKTRFTVDLPLDMPREEVDAHVRGLEQTARYVAGLNIVKVIVVPGKIVNIVVK